LATLFSRSPREDFLCERSFLLKVSSCCFTNNFYLKEVLYRVELLPTDRSSTFARPDLGDLSPPLAL